MQIDASVKQQYAVLQALGGSTGWTAEDGVQAVAMAIKAIPGGTEDVAALQARLEPYTRFQRIDGRFAQAIATAAPFYGVELSGVEPVIAGIRAALADNLAGRKAAESRKALALTPSPEWLAPLTVGSEPLLDRDAQRAISKMASDPRMRALIDVSIDTQEVRELLDASSPDADAGLFGGRDAAEAKKPLDLVVAALPIAGLTAGDAALAIFQTMHVRSAINDDAMAHAIIGHSTGVRSIYSTLHAGLSPRIFGDGETLQVGYRVNRDEIAQYGFKGKEDDVVKYVKAAFEKLQTAVAAGDPASSVKI